tara:strand:+ start:523 stop:756 length:234 start_codon:yes stop_codon:yes gene_type:complete
MNNYKGAEFTYGIGDLVSFTHSRLTEDYIDKYVLTGIIVRERFVYTADNKFLVRTPERDYWVSRPSLTLLSRAENKT